MLYMEVSGQSQAPAALPPGGRPSAYCIGVCVGHRACLDVLEKEKYLYVPRVEPRVVIQLLIVTISFSGYFNATLANVVGENSYSSRAALCGLWCGLVGSLVRILR